MNQARNAILVTLAIFFPIALCADETVSVSFNGETFILKHQWAQATEVINEYVRPDEPLDGWKELISVRWFPELNDHRAAIGGLIRALLALNSKARYSPWSSESGDFTGVDFVTWQDNEFVEFNILIYRAHPSGKGLLAHQYAARAYGEDQREFMESLVKLRQEMLPVVINYQFPEVLDNTRSLSP